MTNRNLALVSLMLFAFLIGFQHDSFILPVVGFDLARFFKVFALSGLICLAFHGLAFAAISSQKKGRD